jgi:hypothetical protein
MTIAHKEIENTLMKEESVAIPKIRMTSTIIKSNLIFLLIEKMKSTQRRRTGARDPAKTQDLGSINREKTKKLLENILSKWRRNKVRLNFQFD